MSPQRTTPPAGTEIAPEDRPTPRPRPPSKQTVRVPADQLDELRHHAPPTPKSLPPPESLPPEAMALRQRLDEAQSDSERISIVSEHAIEQVRLVVEASRKATQQHGDILSAIDRLRLDQGEDRQIVTELSVGVKELSKVALTHTATLQQIVDTLKRVSHRQEQEAGELEHRVEVIEHQLGIVAKATKAQAQRDSHQDLVATKAAETAKAADEVASKAAEAARAAAATTAALQVAQQQQATTIEQHETKLQWVVKRVGWFGLFAFFGSAVVQLLWKLFVR